MGGFTNKSSKQNIIKRMGRRNKLFEKNKIMF